MDLELTDRVAIVTGASKGIGLAITETLVREGARVLAASRTRTPELEALEAGGHVRHVAADLLSPQAPADVVAQALEELGGVDILVNNVGGAAADGGPRASFLEMTDADWQGTLELNLLSAVRTARAALPALLEREGSTIINVASVNATVPNRMISDYSAAKAALRNLTKALSEEFAPQGVRVNVVSPGPVRTPLWTSDGGMGDFIAGLVGTDREGALATAVPQMMQLSTGRMAAAEEIALQVALLASPIMANTTGSEWITDSGFLKGF